MNLQVRLRPWALCVPQAIPEQFFGLPGRAVLLGGGATGFRECRKGVYITVWMGCGCQMANGSCFNPYYNFEMYFFYFVDSMPPSTIVLHLHFQGILQTHLFKATYSNSYVAAVQGADQHIPSEAVLGFSVLPKDTDMQTRGIEPATF